MRMYSRSTPMRPSIVLTTMGKKQKRATTATFGPDAEPEDKDKHGREHHRRDALRRDEERIEGAFRPRREVQEEPERQTE